MKFTQLSKDRILVRTKDGSIVLIEDSKGTWVALIDNSYLLFEKDVELILKKLRELNNVSKETYS